MAAHSAPDRMVIPADYDDSRRTAHAAFMPSTGDVGWVRAYVDGRTTLVETRWHEARTLAASGQPAAAAVAAYIALAVPSKADIFRSDQLTVAEAMGVSLFPDPQHGPWMPSDDMNPSYSRAMAMAFKPPTWVETDLREILAEGLPLAQGREGRFWRQAIEHYTRQGDALATGVAFLHLARAHEAQGLSAAFALTAYDSARQLLHNPLKVYDREGSTWSTADRDVTLDACLESCAGVVRIQTTLGVVRGASKEALKAAVYQLDDLGGDPALLDRGYELLEHSSSGRERSFYRGERVGIANDVWLKESWTRDFVLEDGPEFREDRRSARPPVRDTSAAHRGFRRPPATRAEVASTEVTRAAGSTYEQQQSLRVAAQGRPTSAAPRHP